MRQSLRVAGNFNVEDTHGILLRPEHVIHARSDNLGWDSLYASFQREAPYEASFDAVSDHLMILHLDGPVGVERRLDGKIEHRIVPTGGLFILPGGRDFGVRLEGALESLHIYLRHELVEEVAADFGIPSDKIEILPSLGELDLLAERLALGVREALTDNDPAAVVYADYLARALAARLLRRSPGMDENSAPGGLSSAQLKRVVDFLEANLDCSLSLAHIASSCGLSTTHFARRFKITTGVPPHQYLIQMRIERAKRLLQGSLPIVEVALDCGFAHQEHLTRIFRRCTGFTPAAFRRAAH